jgi:hypothetical protein
MMGRWSVDRKKRAKEEKKRREEESERARERERANAKRTTFLRGSSLLRFPSLLSYLSSFVPLVTLPFFGPSFLKIKIKIPNQGNSYY